MRRRRILAATAAISLSVAALATVHKCIHGRQRPIGRDDRQDVVRRPRRRGRLRQDPGSQAAGIRRDGDFRQRGDRSRHRDLHQGGLRNHDPWSGQGGRRCQRPLDRLLARRPSRHPSQRRRREGGRAREDPRQVGAAGQAPGRRRPARLAAVGHGDDQRVQGAPDRHAATTA